MSILIHDFPQYSEEWWAVRCGVPTASEFSNLITPKTMKPSASMLKYCYQLCGERLSAAYGIDDTNAYQSAAMRNGTLMEPRVRAGYTLETGNDVRQVGFIHNTERNIGCSPDGLVGDDGGLECKYPTAKVMAEWIDTPRPQIPDEHKPQVHGCLIVTGRKWWDFMAWHDGFNPLIVRIERDDFTDALEQCIDEFRRMYRNVWERIKAKNPDPEPVARHPDADILF